MYIDNISPGYHTMFSFTDVRDSCSVKQECFCFYLWCVWRTGVTWRWCCCATWCWTAWSWTGPSTCRSCCTSCSWAWTTPGNVAISITFPMLGHNSHSHSPCEKKWSEIQHSGVVFACLYLGYLFIVCFESLIALMICNKLHRVMRLHESGATTYDT